MNNNAHCGEKSDDFGSRTELSQRKDKKLEYSAFGQAGGSQVVRVPNEDSAAQRARWLSELADALDEARMLMKQLGAAEGRLEAVELYARIEAVRLEVQAMRLRKRNVACGNVGSEWTKDFPWKCSA